MAHHTRSKSHPSFWSNIGQKVQHTAEFVGAMKGLYDTGKAIYSAAQYALPVAAALI